MYRKSRTAEFPLSSYVPAMELIRNITKPLIFTKFRCFIDLH